MSEWKSIDTAPKDGTVILGIEDGVIAQVRWYNMYHLEPCWELAHLHWGDASTKIDPTHWMDDLPCPETP